MSHSSSSDQVDYAARLSNDFKIKECPAFIGATGKQTKGPKVLCFNDADIPLTVEGFKDRKQLNVGLVVVDCLSDGYTRVPYECTNNGVYKLGKNPLPLSEKSVWPEDKDGALSMLTCWPYGIVEGCPKDKDDRNEDFKWEIHPGMVICTMFWADSARGGKPSDKGKGIQCTAECDVIKAFTLMEIELVCKGWSKWEPGDVNPEAKNKPRDICPVKKGYGMSVVSMNPFNGASLYSVADKIGKIIPATLDESRAKQMAWQAKFHSIKDLIQTQSVPFFVQKVSKDATIDLDDRPELANEPKQICISRWGVSDGGNCIDVLHDDAMRATNATDIRAACALLELAANAGALSVVVCANQYRPGKEHIKSMYYGFPVIDTRILLQCVSVPVDASMLTVDDTENYFVFETDFQVAFPVLKKGDDETNDGGDDAGARSEEDCQSSEFMDGEEQMLCPHLYISKDPFMNVKGPNAVRTPDFMLVGSTDVVLQKAYFARFVHPTHPQRCVLWGGYINMSKPQITMPGAMGAAASAASAAAAGRKRAQWIQHARSFDPFAGEMPDQGVGEPRGAAGTAQPQPTQSSPSDKHSQHPHLQRNSSESYKPPKRKDASSDDPSVTHKKKSKGGS